MTIYLDNAATSYPKPEVVYQRVNHIIRHIGGNPGRGGHRMALEASRVVFEARETISRLLNIQDSSRIVFTRNATEGINLVLKGLLRPGDHVVTTTVEHNAVGLTLRRLEGGGVRVTRVTASREGYIRPGDIERAITKDTRLVSVVHASNVLGTIMPIGEIGEFCRRKGVPLMIDAAQTAGAIPIDVEALKVDILVATGHKALFGPQGTGFVYMREDIEPLPLIDGGTGEGDGVPETPDRFEAGTLNTPGIGGLQAGVEFLLKEGVETIRGYEEGLTLQLLEGLEGIKGVSILGPRDVKEGVSLVSFNIGDEDPTEIGYILDNRYGIMVRAGTHCAHEAHKTAGTWPGGAVRVSPGYFNTPEEVEWFLRAVGEIAKSQ